MKQQSKLHIIFPIVYVSVLITGLIIKNF